MALLLTSACERASLGSVAGECLARQNDAQHILAEANVDREQARLEWGKSCWLLAIGYWLF